MHGASAEGRVGALREPILARRRALKARTTDARKRRYRASKEQEQHGKGLTAAARGVRLKEGLTPEGTLAFQKPQNVPFR